MADTRISELTELAGASVANDDEFVVVDKSDTTMAASGTDKRMTAASLAAVPALTAAFATAAQGAKADTAVQPTIVDAKGDLLVGSAADTLTRLPVGTNDYVLTADSTQAAGVKWAASAGGGAVATDAIWDAKGDLAVGTGANTATKLTVGANGTFPVANSSASSGLSYVTSPRIVPKKLLPYAHGSNFSNGAASQANSVFFYPFWTDRPVTISTINMKCTTLESGASMRFGVYSISGQPEYNSTLTLVADYGTVSLATTGLKTASGSTIVGPGWFVIGAACSNHSTARHYTVSNTLSNFIHGGLGTSATTDAGAVLADTNVACGWGAWPNGGTYVSGGMPASVTPTAWMRSDSAQVAVLLEVA